MIETCWMRGCAAALVLCLASAERAQAASQAPTFGGLFKSYPISDEINHEIFVETITAKRALDCLFSVSFQIEYDTPAPAGAWAYSFTTAKTIDGGQTVGGSQHYIYGIDQKTPSPSSRTSHFTIPKGKTAKFSLFITNWARLNGQVHLEHSYACF